MDSAGRWRRRVVLVAVGVAGCLALGAVVLSPLALGLLDAGRDWSRLSDIGQTYGATSAVLAALALGGVAAALAVQVRQSRSEQVGATRAFYTELVRLELEDPELYRPCWTPGAADETPDAQRRHIYVDLMMTYAQMGHETGTLPEPLLRDMMSGVFRGEPGRRYWRSARDSWHGRAAERRRDRRFVRVVEDEYARAVAAGPPAATPPPTAPPTAPPHTAPLPAALSPSAVPTPDRASARERDRRARLTVAAVAGAVGGLAVAVARRRPRG